MTVSFNNFVSLSVAILTGFTGVSLVVKERTAEAAGGNICAGMCEACHDPHGSQNELQLLKRSTISACHVMAILPILIVRYVLFIVGDRVLPVFFV